ncbi:unnamed protein product [Natator depressus]
MNLKPQGNPLGGMLKDCSCQSPCLLGVTLVSSLHQICCRFLPEENCHPEKETQQATSSLWGEACCCDGHSTIGQPGSRLVPGELMQQAHLSPPAPCPHPHVVNIFRRQQNVFLSQVRSIKCPMKIWRGH